MTDTERIDELEETIQELQETINSLTEDNTTLEETVDELREEFNEYTGNVKQQMTYMVRQIEKLLNVSYTYDRQRDTLQVQAQITRDMLEYAGPEALDMAYQNMKDQLTNTLLKKPYKYPNNIKYNPPAVW
jgi:vacuolar-type H+-ATPase subunit E/Vma4